MDADVSGSKKDQIMNNVGLMNESTRIHWIETCLKKIPEKARILDAGAGECQFKKYCSHLQYVSQDFGKYDGKGDGGGLQTSSWAQNEIDIISDITSIPEPDNSFDAIMCIEVFEHLPDPVAAIREFSRLMKPEAFLILTTPFCSLTHFAPYHFHTGFNKYFYQTHLPSNGFEIMEMETNGNFFEYLGQEIRRIPNISKRYSKCRPNLVQR